jgi:hypothetical protein
MSAMNRFAAATLLAIAAWSGPAAAQTSPAASAPAAAAAVEPKATEALQRMGRHLQSLQSFSVKAQTSTDQVLTSGQKVRLDATTTMWVKRPDRLRIDMKSDRRSRQFYFDGKQVTVYGKASGYYARVPAPPTLKELVAKLSDEYGLELPLADLFTWGGDPAQLSALTGAAAIGLATVRGTPCDQYAFRQDGLDWQLWIQRGAQPLPRRLVLTTTDDPARPEYSVDFDWSAKASPPASVFVFKPPPGSHEIPMRRADGTVATKR